MALKSKSRMRQELAVWMALRGHSRGIYMQLVTPWTPWESGTRGWKTYIHVRPDGTLGTTFHTAQEHEPRVVVRVRSTADASKHSELLRQLYQIVAGELATPEEKILMELV